MDSDICLRAAQDPSSVSVLQLREIAAIAYNALYTEELGLLQKVLDWRGFDGDGITDPLRSEIIAASDFATLYSGKAQKRGVAMEHNSWCNDVIKNAMCNNDSGICFICKRAYEAALRSENKAIVALLNELEASRSRHRENLDFASDAQRIVERWAQAQSTSK